MYLVWLGLINKTRQDLGQGWLGPVGGESLGGGGGGETET